MAKETKTNVMRILEQKQIPYKQHCYEGSGAISGKDVAKVLEQNPEQVFKTLVTKGKSGEHYVFVIPVEEELNLKKAAKAAKEKSIEMIPQKELLPLTGYIHGGCSPIGQKKQFATFMEETALLFESVLFSAGKIGYQVEVNPEDLDKVIPVTFCELTGVEE